MSRPRKLDRPVRFHTNIPTSLKERLDEALLDPVTGEVPVGSYQAIALLGIDLFLKENAQTKGEPYKSIIVQVDY